MACSHRYFKVRMKPQPYWEDLATTIHSSCLEHNYFSVDDPLGKMGLKALSYTLESHVLEEILELSTIAWNPNPILYGGYTEDHGRYFNVVTYLNNFLLLWGAL